MIAAEKINGEKVSFETDRSLFIGRGRTTANPAAMIGKMALSDSEGPVLDPIVSIRYIITIEPKREGQGELHHGPCRDQRPGFGAD